MSEQQVQQVKQRRFVIETFDDAIEALDALEEFFRKVRDANERFKRIVRTIKSIEEERPTFRFTRHSRIEDELMEAVLKEALSKIKIRVEPSTEDKEIEEEVKEIDEQFKRLERR